MDGVNNAYFATVVGVSEATVGRWLRGQVRPSADQVISLCRIQGVSALSGLLAAGYLLASDIENAPLFPRILDISEYSDLEIAKELVRRIEDGQEHPDLDEPVSDVGGQVDDLTTAEERDVKSRYATAANDDDSADRIYPGAP